MLTSSSHHVQIQFGRSHYRIRLFLNCFAHNPLNRYLHHLDLQSNFYPALPKKDPTLPTFYDLSDSSSLFLFAHEISYFSVHSFRGQFLELIQITRSLSYHQSHLSSNTLNHFHRHVDYEMAFVLKPPHQKSNLLPQKTFFSL